MSLEVTTFDLCSRQLGLASREQLADLGVDFRSVNRLLNAGRLTSLSSRVVRAAGAPTIAGQSAMAAILDEGRGSVLSHRSSAAWWGVPGYSLRNLEIVREGRATPRTTMATVHRVRRLPSSWLTTFRGIPIVRPELCALQLCAVEHPAKAERSLDRLWSRRLLSGESLVALVAEYGKRGRNGTALMRKLTDARGVDYVPSASGLEDRFDWVLRHNGLPAMRREVDAGGALWTGRVDRLASDLPHVVEIQSKLHHAALVDEAADQERIAALESDGFTVTPIDDDILWTDEDEVVRRVTEGRREAERRLRITG